MVSSMHMCVLHRRCININTNTNNHPNASESREEEEEEYTDSIVFKYEPVPLLFQIISVELAQGVLRSAGMGSGGGLGWEGCGWGKERGRLLWWVG